MIETADDLLKATVAGDVVQLWRYDGQAGTYRYLAPFEPAALEALGVTEFTRQRFGGGKFKARIRHRDGTFGLARVFDVDGPAKIPDDVTPPGAVADSSRQPPAWVDRFLMPFAGALGAALAGFVTKKLLEDKPVDPLMLELLKRSAVGPGVDPLELQKALLEAEARGELRGRELGQLKALAEAEPSTGGALGAIDRALPQVLAVLNRKISLEERRALPQLSDPGELDTGDDTSAPDGRPKAPEDPLVALLLSIPMVGRKFLLAAAEGDEPPEIYAGMTLGKLDDMTYQRMPALLERADFVDVFCGTWPAFGAFRPWVEDFAAALKGTLEASATAEDDDDAATGPGDTKAAP